MIISETHSTAVYNSKRMTDQNIYVQNTTSP